MNILQVSLRNYRGIRERTVNFPARGVTVIHGPNEIGKSSIMEAVDIILQYQATSGAQTVVAIKPVDRDAGSEILVTLKTGPYLLRYFKRYHKNKEALLECLEPDKRQWTGQAAHERMLEILSETMDMGLFRALRVQQGTGVTQEKLADAPSLQEALDRAAGGQIEGQKEQSLYEKVEEEYRRYFTKKTQKATGSFLQRQDDLIRAQADCDEAAQRLNAVEEASLGLEQLKVRARHIQENRHKAEERKALLAGRLQHIHTLEESIGIVAIQLKEATWREQQAIHAQKTRNQLIQEVDELRGDIARMTVDIGELERLYREAEESLQDVDRQADTLREARDMADGVWKNARQHLDYRQNQQIFEEIGRRLTIAENATRTIAEQKALIQSIRLTEAGLLALREQRDAVMKASSAMEAGAPEVTVTRLGPVSVSIDDETLNPQQTISKAVSSAMAIQIEGMAEVMVRAGSSLDKLCKIRVKEEQKLQHLFEEWAIDSITEAERLWQRKYQAKVDYRVAEQRLADMLHGQSLEALREAYLSLKASLEAFQKDAMGDEALGDLASEVKRRESVLHDILTEYERLAAIVKRTEKLRSKRGEEFHLAKQRLEMAVDALSGKEAALSDSRWLTSDARLDEELQEATLKTAELSRVRQDQEQRLLALEPDAARREDENLAAVLLRLDTDRQSNQDQQTRLEGRIEASGGEGLYEEATSAKTRLQRVQRALELETLRAEAARWLYQIMTEERSRAQDLYRLPLQQRIQELGRPVFGETFQVVLDSNLLIKERHMEHQTVSFDSLSTGAQEQLVLLTRLAAAQLVAGNEGVPVILDDALGSTDEFRLERLGAVLNAVGQTCQVIILTCAPERYHWVGHATMIDVLAESLMDRPAE